MIVVIAGVDGAGRRDGEPAQRVDGPAPDPDARVRHADATRSASARRCGATGGRCRPRARSASSSAPGTPSCSSARFAGDIGEGRVRSAAWQAIRRFERMLVRRGRAPAQVLVPPLEGRAEEAPRESARATRTRAGASRATTERCTRIYRASSHALRERVLRQTSTGEAPWVSSRAPTSATAA